MIKIPCRSTWAALSMAAVLPSLPGQAAELSASNPRYFATEPLGSVTFFVADTNTRGSELYYLVDGQEPRFVTDIGPGSVGCNARDLKTLRDGFVVFSAETAGAGVEPWASDGTAAGTVRLRDVAPGTDGSYPTRFTRVGAMLFFVADDGAAGRELWRTDGTPAGTVRVRDILTGAAGSDPDSLISHGGLLFFAADEGSGGGRELWRSDGTEAGTVRVRDILAGPGSSAPTGLVSYGARVLFAADDGTSGRELWTSDGTTAGTARVLDIHPGTGGSMPLDLTMGLEVMFTADNGTVGRELWKTDGTAAGTVLVKDIVVGPASTQIGQLTWCLLRHFFAADDGVNGLELWVTDGTAAGTSLVRDIRPGPAGCSPANLFADRLSVLFVADDDANGRELWRSDGTIAGTQIQLTSSGLRNGLASSDPSGFHRRSAPGETHPILFTAENDTNGRELWFMSVGGTPQIHSDLNVALPQPGYEFTAIPLGGGQVEARLRVFGVPGQGSLAVEIELSAASAPAIAIPGLRGSLRVAIGGGLHVGLPVAFTNGYAEVRLPHGPLGNLYSFAVQGVVLENTTSLQPAMSSNGIIAGGLLARSGYSIEVKDGEFSDRTFRYRLPILGQNQSGPRTLTLGLVYRRFVRDPEVFVDSFVRVFPFQPAPETAPLILEGTVELIPVSLTGRKSDRLELRLYQSWPNKPSDSSDVVWMSNC